MSGVKKKKSKKDRIFEDLEAKGDQQILTQGFRISHSFVAIIFVVCIFLVWIKKTDVKGTDFIKDLDNKSSNPAIVWFTDVWSFPKELPLRCRDENMDIQCDVFKHTWNNTPVNPEAYLFYGSYIKTFPLPRHPKTIWGLVHEESVKNKPELLYNNFLSLFNFSATFSRYSDVAIPLMWLAGLDGITGVEFYVNTSVKNSFLKEIAPVIYMQSDCDTATERDQYVKKLMEYIPVDSYGVCLRNKNLPFGGVYKYEESDGVNRNYLNNLFDDQLLSFIAKYKFIVSIENGICNDYITEKLWRPLEMGVVPIYYGSPLIRDWLPNNKSAILLEDFPTPELLSRHLHYLLSNNTAYEEYLEHKTSGLISNVRLVHEATDNPNQADINAMMEEFQCFVCQKLHSKNDSEIHITRDHYDCPIPPSALTLSVNPDNKWVQIVSAAEKSANRMYEEVLNSTRKLIVNINHTIEEEE